MHTCSANGAVPRAAPLAPARDPATPVRRPAAEPGLAVATKSPGLHRVTKAKGITSRILLP